MSTDAGPPLLRIGDWIVDGSLNRLRHAVSGDERPLRHKAMALLLLLAERPGELLSREQIEARIWGGNAFVAPKAINTAIWTIRQALGDDPEAPRYLQTIAKRGYRLIAAVEALPREVAPATPLPPRASGWRRWRWPGAALLLLAVAGGAWQLTHRPPAPSPAAASQPQPLTQYPGVEFAGAISPDGQLLAFAWWQGRGDAELYVRDVARPEAQPRAVGGAVGDVTALAWSADSQALAFIARPASGGCTLWRVGLRDGSRQALSACEPLFTPSLAWSDDGQWLAFTAREGGDAGLFLMRADGRAAKRRFTRADNPLLPDHQPAFSPDGRHLAFVRAAASSGERLLFEIALPDGAPRALARLPLRSLHGLSYSVDGRDLILSTTRQDSRQLLRWQRSDGQLRALGLEGSAPQRTRNGDLVLALLRSHVSLASLELGRAGATLQPLERALASRRLPSLRGEWLAFVTRDASHSQLWLQRGDLAAQVRLSLRGDIGRAAWSPDGRTLAFVGSCGRGGRLALCALPADGGEVRAWLDDGLPVGPPAWTAMGPVFGRPDAAGHWRLWRLEAGEPRPIAGSPRLLPQSRPQARSDGSLLLVDAELPRLLAWQPGRAAPQVWPLPAAPGRLVAFAVHPQGVLLLVRGSDERLLLQTAPGSTPRELARFALGSVPETAAMTVSDDGRRLVVERADLAQGDLMRLPGGAASP